MRCRRLWFVCGVVMVVFGGGWPHQTSAGVSGGSSDAISVSVLMPQPQQVVNEVMRVEATVVSTDAVQGVVAQVGSITATLVLSQTWTYPPRPGFVGMLSLMGLPRGPKTLVVTAVDVFGATQQTQVPFVYDRKARVDVSEPVDLTVARPMVPVRVACTDDDPVGCQGVSLTRCDAPWTVLASGLAGLSQTLSFEAQDGQFQDLCVTAVDSAGQVTQQRRGVFVEMSPVLVDVEQDEGEIWDVDARSMLVFRSGMPTGTLVLRDRVTGGETVVLADSRKVPQYGFLTPRGALFVTQSGDVLTSVLYEWRDGVLIALGHPDSAQWLRVVGDYAVWSEGTRLFRHRVSDGATIEVAQDAGNTDQDVAPSGDVVYWSMGYQIVQYHDGITTTLTSDVGMWNTYPVMDGVNVVFRRCNPSTGECAIVAHTAAGEVVLTSLEPRMPGPGGDYQVNGGWMAFTRRDALGQQHVWRRSPSGDVVQVSWFGGSSVVDALGAHGEVVVLHNNRRYLAFPGGSLMAIGSGLGHSVWIGEQLYRRVGRSLLRVNPYAQFVPLLRTSP